jgi:BirA family transcriptional regulator, biotin operon repressor / biotin---[acetyl-CoA-carboxylase] ligase
MSEAATLAGAVRWDGDVLPLQTRRVGRPLLHFDRVASTMPLAHALAGEGAADGTALVAEEQYAGQGRRGRQWSAPHGTAILCSLVLRPPLPPHELFLLTAAVSLGLCRGVARHTGLEPRVKWPNDLLIGGRKVAGVLTATRLSGDALDYAVVGFGLNVNLARSELPPATPGGLGATSLAIELGQTVDRLALLGAVLSAIDDAYDLLHRGALEALHGAWRSRLGGLGERVRVETEAGAIEGTFQDVDRGGALVLETPQGRQRILVGDVILGPRGGGAGG